MRAFFILGGAETSGFPWALSSLVFIPHKPIFKKSYGTPKKIFFRFFYFFLVFGARRARGVREARAMVGPVH
jgi:hypothetical protein